MKRAPVEVELLLDQPHKFLVELDIKSSSSSTSKETVYATVMGSMFRSEEVCLVQLFLQSGSAYNCVSELGELGIVEFRDLNPNVNAFQRKFVSEVRRCEELEKTFVFLEQEIVRTLSQTLQSPIPTPAAPQPRELLTIEEESERLARELKEVSRNRDSLRAQFTQLGQYRGVLKRTHSLTASQAPLGSFDSVGLTENRQDVRLSFVAGVVHPWKVPAFERLLWRACRGYIIVDFHEMEEKLEHLDSGEEVQWTVFLISFWGDQIGQKVKKICDCFHTQTFPYPENQTEREEILNGLRGRIEDIKSVMGQTEQYMQQLLARALARLPEWRVQVQKCKAVQMVLNLCSPSVTDKCLIAEAWCPVSQLPALQSALREGGATTSPPTLFPTNAFSAGFQNIVDAYGVASYREVNPAVYTIITFPFLFAVMFGDVGHGLLMTLAALWMVLEEKDLKLTNNSNEIWRMMFGGRYLILLMGLFSIYTGAIYNECFSRGLATFSSGWHVLPNAEFYNWTEDTFKSNQYLSLDPNITGVFTGPYPFGIDPIWGLANNHLTFLNSYKMKMSVIIGVIHMTFGVCLSLFNYIHFRDISSVFLVLIPELCFMLCLFGYLVFMVIYKWVVYGPMTSNSAPSILIHFIDMFLFTENKDNKPLYEGQIIVQKVLVIVAVLSVPVLLLGKPIQEYVAYRKKKTRQTGDRRPLLSENGSINAHQGDMETGEEEEFDASDVFMHQAIHTIEYCLGCISNTASYLRLWALSLAHAQLSEVLWLMVMGISFKQLSYVGSVIMVGIFAAFAVLTVSILLVMEGLSAFLHALRLHWVEFQNKFYSGSGYKFSPFAFSLIICNSSIN
ncbi:V-type proton ATPase 116 kDa subunit a isoform 3 [Triplophysa tibetana]|uniref:V-type proton ATPase subunit a n=1 Tax=Triplophysa tibetana TaxID=1572043 RepID=A0A5A9NHM6_9TELE|nr:V-type proton ATPase 116 kDa subunit a isoform 3 [Triplophysa tibetana]